MYFVALGSLIAIPLAKKTIDSIYPYFISNVACAMDLSMSPLVYVGLFAVIMAMYFVINALLVRKIDRVTPAEVLKNRE
jgi:putative ABC transport system permease protein